MTDLVLGGGLAGLAFGAFRGRRSTVLEAEAEPGGLVRSHHFDVPGVGRYWFDHVLHLLYFSDEETADFVAGLMGGILERCPPEAWVETAVGTCRYPLQLNLAGLSADTIVSALLELIAGACGPPRRAGENLHEALLQTFGSTLCRVFFHPYNQKVWARPLTELAPALAWTITPPDLELVIRGAVTDACSERAYNCNGWYPRPPAGAPIRGMGLLSLKLAERVPDLRLRHKVTKINLARRAVSGTSAAGRFSASYESLISTLPLPVFAGMAQGLPARLRDAARQLRHNRVWAVAICFRGPRPTARGLWRYYADETLAFTRLVHPHEFDALAAPPDGWSLLAEVVQAAEEPILDTCSLAKRVIEDVKRAGALAAGAEVVATHVWCADPAYVVFTNETESIVRELSDAMREAGVHLLGRYGRWTYLSMAQVIGEARRLANALSGEGVWPIASNVHHERADAES